MPARPRRDSFAVDMKIILPEDVQLELDQSQMFREQARQSQAEAARLARTRRIGCVPSGYRCATLARLLA